MTRTSNRTTLFTCLIRQPQDLLRVWTLARRCGAAADWPVSQQMQLAVRCCELARIGWQQRSSSQAPTLRVVHADEDGGGAIHMEVAPLPTAPMKALLAAEASPERGTATLWDVVDDWQVVAVDGELGVKLQALLALPADVAAPAAVDPQSVPAENGFSEALVDMFSARNLDMLRLVQQLEQRNAQQEELTQEIEETNRGVVALYGELEDQAKKLQDLNATLEQRVAERTAEVEKRVSQLRALASQLTQAEHRERRRIAQMLHDGLQQLIVASKMRLAMMQGQLADQAAHASLKEIDSLMDEALQASRNLTIELAPPVLFQSSLKTAMEWLASHVQQKHKLAVEVTGDEALPDLPEDLRAIVFQATQELLFNVVKHADTDAAQIRLETASDETLQISVIDQGQGFDPDKPAEETAEPHGFGLFSIRERVDWYGGRFDVVSHPGEGTRITLTVPLTSPTVTSAPQQASPAVAEAAPDSSAADSDRICRVLLADDHRLMREGLRRLIDAQPDMQVIDEAADGQQAVDLAREGKPHIVLMDVNMPVMDGVEATRQITTDQPDVQIIALSMHEADSVAREMASAGAAGYCSKDGAPDALCEMIRQTFDRRFANTTAD